MFQYGYNIGIINETQDVIEEFIQNAHELRTNTTLSDDSLHVIWSLVVSFFDVGGMTGGLMTVLVTSSLGRKQGLLLFNTFGIVGTLLTILSKPIGSYEIIILGRFLVGCHCGSNTVLVPMYISEISPKTLRGAFGTLSNIGAAIGLVLAMVVGIHETLGTSEKWLYIFALNIIPSILQLIILPFCPDSPYFLLITKGDGDAAKNALKRLRGTFYVEDELEEIEKEKCTLDQEHQFGMLEVLYKKDLHLPLFISVVMVLSVKLSGAIIIFYYSTKLFIYSGIRKNIAPYATTGLGVIILLISIVSIPLIDLAGRRVLHLSGLGGMFFSNILFTISLVWHSMHEAMPYIAVVSVFSFMIFLSIGPASIPWIIMAELFTHSSRPAAMSIVMVLGWLTKFFVGLSYPHLHRWLGYYILLPFTVSLFFFWIFLYLMLPETKNKTYLEIAELFRKRNESHD